ncbi:MAG TPA: outer membrane beta-barrel protein, partial [Chitinophagales bacterium]|nr:outer membrane beta-barrel protein [Chitinophagales bacterium]
MKKIMLMAAILMGVMIAKAQVPPPPPPPPPAGPVIKIEENKITIISPSGDEYIINEDNIMKNGVVLDTDSEAFRLEMDAIGKQLEALKLEDLNLTINNEDYAELMADLDELDAEMEALDNSGIQIDTLPGDSTSITIGNWRLIVAEDGEDAEDVDVSFGKVPEVEEIDDRDVDVFDTEWWLFDMGYNTFLNSDYKAQIDEPYTAMEDLHGWGSFDVNLHMFRSRVNIAKGYLNFNYGLSFEWHHYRFDNNFSIMPDVDTFTINTETIEYEKNKFNTTHLTLPVLIGFETKPWDTEHSFRMQFGYSPGLMLRGKTKLKYDGQKDIEKDDFNLAQFRHEVNYIIGYGDFNLYASYDVNSMFAEGEGPDLHPFSVGLV